MKQPMPKSHTPRAEQRTRIRLNGFAGIDRRGGADDGALVRAAGVDPRAFPALKSAPALRPQGISLPGEVLSLHAIGEELYAFTNVSGMVLLHRIRNGRVQTAEFPQTAAVKTRSLLCFNRYSDPLDPLGGTYSRIVIILPDKLCILPDNDTLTLTRLGAEEITLPPMDCGAVHLSRLFAAAGDRLYASAYNSPADFDLDTAADVGAANAWATVAQSNTRASGDFTAMTVFDGHVLAFKRHFTHIINNTKNPFRVADLLTVGTDNAETLAELAGELYFSSGKQLYRYNGNSLREIAAPLALGSLSRAQGVGYDGLYLLAPASGGVYAYSPARDAWGALADSSTKIAAMAASADACYALTEAGELLMLDEATDGLSCESTPLLLGSMAPRRLVRLALAATLGEGASLSVGARESSGRVTPLLDAIGTGGTAVLLGRGYTPQGTAFSLVISGKGALCIHRTELVAAGDDEF